MPTKTSKPAVKPAPVKRILSITIKREVDTDGDTSYLGEYSDKAKSEFSIDRMHDEDCQSIEANRREAVDKLERIIGHIVEYQNTLEVDSDEWHAYESAYSDCSEAQEETEQCDCGGHRISSRELPYFNPSFNYVDKDGHTMPGMTPEEVRKYVKQDYERMEGLNSGQWYYLGVYATAEVLLNAHESNSRFGGLTQRIRSGGLWGIESDSNHSYFEEVKQDELANLRDELLAAGFSRRAIAKAFKNVEEVDA